MNFYPSQPPPSPPPAGEGFSQLADTREAFDSVAADYDGPLGNNDLVQGVRRRTLDAVLRSVPAGSQLLDLGCGTGLDAMWLAQRGYRVTAIDWSPAMVERARRRMADTGVNGAVDVHHLGIHELDRLGERSFDAAYSNLGALNCVADLAPVAGALALRLRSGGTFVASVIGRVCPWEVAFYLWKRQWSRARARWTNRIVRVPLNGRTVWTRYYMPSEFNRTFERAGFTLRSLRGLGLLVPPPYLLGVAQRHPKAVAALAELEDRVAAWPGLRDLGDHFLIVMERDG